MKSKIIAISVIILTAFSACNANTENSQQPRQQQISFEKNIREVPKDLEKIEESIEKIFSELNAPSSNVENEKKNEVSKDNKNNEGNKEAKNGNNQDKNKNEKEGQTDKNNQNDNKEQEENKADKSNQQNDWTKADSIINNLHYQWNNFTSFAMEINAPGDLIDNFSVSLNNLTNMILKRDTVNSLMAANNLYSYIPDLYMLFDTPYSPEIKRLRHYTRSTMLNALTENWADSEKDLQNLKSSWSFYKASVQKDRPERTIKLDYSIRELETVINEKNKSLSLIKGRVTLNNIDVLEKEEKRK